MNAKTTPLSSQHQARGARMVIFGGWQMPLSFGSILEEHHHTRHKASIFDTCHMGLFELSGTDAERTLELLLTARIASLPVGRCRYTYMLREDGGILDDLTVYRLERDRFLLVVNAATTTRDREWILAHLIGETRFRDLGAELGKVDVQGPDSRAALEQAFQTRMPDMPYFGHTRLDLAGVPCLVSRTGYTGERGYEIYCPREKVGDLWNIILGCQTVRPAGLGARDTLRMEMGYPLYGQDLSEDRTPVPVSGKRYLDLEKEFIGRAAVVRELAEPIRERFVGLRLDTRRAARPGDKVLAESRPVGVVTSGAYGPSMGVAIALGYIESEHSSPGTIVEIEHDNSLLRATVADLPFYKQGTART